MATTESLQDPRFSLAVSAPLDARLRQRYLALDSLSASKELPLTASGQHRTMIWERWARLLVHQSALHLELLLVNAATWELFAEAGETTLKRLGQEWARREVLTRYGVDPMQVVRDALPIIKGNALEISPEHAARIPIPSSQAVVRAVRASVESYPADVILDVAARTGVKERGERAHSAYRALKLFLLRHDEELHARIETLGELYQIGRIDVPQIAALLNETPSDVVALLEKRGLARPISEILLPEAERAARLRSIRIDREKRSRIPSSMDSLVDRSVIASERIEGVDARAWMIRKSTLES